MEKVRLELIGITYNQIESGVYAVILQEAGGDVRIPIIIGFPEAQAIECKLQEVVTPRPLTHDLMVNIMAEFGLMLREVNIYKMPNGVFAAELVLSDGYNTHYVDSRSSDAIALAIRVNAPIFTTREVLEEAGFRPRNKAGGEQKVTAGEEQIDKVVTDLSGKNLPQLRADMQAAAEAEDYETAAKIKAEIEKRENEKQKEQNSENG